MLTPEEAESLLIEHVPGFELLDEVQRASNVRIFQLTREVNERSERGEDYSELLEEFGEMSQIFMSAHPSKDERI